MTDPFERFGRYTCMTVDEAPAGVGLYAWYASLAAGPKDWEAELEQGVDVGAQRLRALLGRHTARYAAPPLELSARGTFSTVWSGSLSDETAVPIARTLQRAPAESASDYDATRAPCLQESLDSPALRQKLVTALEAALPVLSAPLYIGVATCLRERLSTHVHQFQEFSARASKDPSVRESLRRARKSSFATRAVAMGYTPAQLVVWTLSLDEIIEEDAPPEKLRLVAEAAEWLLNRWHRPFLGRR